MDKNDMRKINEIKIPCKFLLLFSHYPRLIFHEYSSFIEFQRKGNIVFYEIHLILQNNFNIFLTF